MTVYEYTFRSVKNRKLLVRGKKSEKGEFPVFYIRLSVPT